MARLDEIAATLNALPAHVLVGVSGGADSVALLLVLVRVPGLRVEAAHVNHGLRGEASDGDEAFVRELCARLGVPLRCYRAQPPAHPGEGWAREARYGFFRQAMAAGGAQALVLAHHLDDQAETLLLHLLRGAGLTGLAGMRADGVVDGLRIIRPLLGYAREDLRGALIELGQPWREDATNADPRYLRNAVRTQLLPLMEQLAPGAARRMAATAGLLRADADALAAQANAFLDAHGGESWLRLAPLTELPKALQAQVLRTWWQRAVGCKLDERSLDLPQTEALAALIDGHAGQKANLPDRWTAQRGWSCLHLVPPQKAVPAGPVPAADGAALCGIALRVLPAACVGDGVRSQAVPKELLAGCVLRTRRPGDWICPFGSSGKQSLQDYFTNRRVDAPFRDRVPLLCRSSEVLLAAGVGAGNVPALTDVTGAACLAWDGSMPWMQA